MADFQYVGSELELFAHVVNWKSYWASKIRPLLKGDVLEVGAGIGSNTTLLDCDGPGRWVCLEPDSQLLEQMKQRLADAPSSRKHEIVCGTLDAVRGQKFDSIIYIDVLEHIPGDREELIDAASFLNPGGMLAVLSPAHQWLFSPFDRAIGHCRRYNRQSLAKVSPPNLKLDKIFYLDCCGLALSAANALLLRQSSPTKAQLKVWDSFVIPVSRVVDPLIGHSMGKTIVGIWRS